MCVSVIKPDGPVMFAALLVTASWFGKKSQVDSYFGQQLCPFSDGALAEIKQFNHGQKLKITLIEEIPECNSPLSLFETRHA